MSSPATRVAAWARSYTSPLKPMSLHMCAPSPFSSRHHLPGLILRFYS
jgi:hypothetical protein